MPQSLTSDSAVSHFSLQDTVVEKVQLSSALVKEELPRVVQLFHDILHEKVTTSQSNSRESGPNYA